MSSKPPRSDEDLVGAVRAGDAEAASILFERYHGRLRTEVRRRVRGVVRRRVGDSDVVQDAWMAVFSSLDEFVDRGPGSFGRWLRQILKHKASDTVRKHLGTAKRGGRAEISHAGDRRASSVIDLKPTPGTAAVKREEGERIGRAMATLTDDQRVVLECVHRRGMTLAEVGAALGRSPNAVSKSYGRAVRAMGRALSRESESA